jgi:hypothetical protein
MDTANLLHLTARRVQVKDHARGGILLNLIKPQQGSKCASVTLFHYVSPFVFVLAGAEGGSRRIPFTRYYPWCPVSAVIDDHWPLVNFVYRFCTSHSLFGLIIVFGAINHRRESTPVSDARCTRQTNRAPISCPKTNRIHGPKSVRFASNAER